MRPFRAEHIGSLLRPAALLAARREFDGGSLSAQALRDAEDRFIRDAVALQERVGLEVITDGEYRRVIYFGHFLAAVSGFTEMDAEITFQDARGGAMTYRTRVVTGRRGHDPDAMVGRYVSLVNDALRDRPAGMTVGIHLPREQPGQVDRRGWLRRRGRADFHRARRRCVLPRVRFAARRELRTVALH